MQTVRSAAIRMMRFQSWQRSASVMVSSVLLALSGVLSGISPAAASCGSYGYYYSAGYQYPSGWGDAVKGTIAYTNPTVCSSEVSHSVDLWMPGSNSYGGGWVQAGWYKDSLHTSPRGYCESMNPNTGIRDFYDFSIVGASHTYEWIYDKVSTWDCELDYSIKHARSTSSLGMTYGEVIDVQGEAHRQGAQIGRVWPATLLFSSLQNRKYQTWSWYTVDVTRGRVDSPYGWSEPGVGQMEVWTNP